MNYKSICAQILTLLVTVMSPTATFALEGEIHALLVGVTNYPKLTNAQQLDGPINDVKEAHDTLVERFGSDQGKIEERIVSLHENQPKNLRPTYENIAREFAALAGRVSEGDQVFILLSGHGSQDLDDADDASDDYEPDGLDEVFLPRDVKGWNEKENLVEGAIRDDQLI